MLPPYIEPVPAAPTDPLVVHVPQHNTQDTVDIEARLRSLRKVVVSNKQEVDDRVDVVDDEHAALKRLVRSFGGNDERFERACDHGVPTGGGRMCVGGGGRAHTRPPTRAHVHCWWL